MCEKENTMNPAGTKPARIHRVLAAALLTFSMTYVGVMSSPASAEDYETMKLRISIGDTVLSAILADNDTARDFASLLPLSLTLEDYHGIEKISDLPRALTTEGAPRGIDPDVGDITYYAPWGNLAIFYRDFGYARGLVGIGRIEGDMEILSEFDARGATIELAD